MKVAFIGGNGHHYLRWLFKQQDCPIDRPAVVAGDGYDDGKARQFSDGLGTAEWAGESRYFDDGRRMLDVERPDVLSVGAVYGYNGRWIIEGLKRGMKVISDKPIAATWEQFHEIEALSKALSKTLVTEFDLRARPAFRAAKLAVERGDVGTVSLVTAQKSYRWGTRPDWYKDRALYAGTLLWVASHGVDLIRYTTGLKALRVTGHQDNAARREYLTMEDHTASLFELEGHATGIVHADFLRPAAAATHGDDRIRVIGGGGVVEVRDGKCLLIKNDSPEQDITEIADTREPYQEMFAAITGERTDIYSTAQSLEAAKLLLHARDAADRREWIDV